MSLCFSQTKNTNWEMLLFPLNILSYCGYHKIIQWFLIAQTENKMRCFTWRGEPGALLWLVNPVFLPVHHHSFLQQGFGQMSALRRLWSVGTRTAGGTTAPREEPFMKSSTCRRVSAPWQVGEEIQLNSHFNLHTSECTLITKPLNKYYCLCCRKAFM